MSINQMEETPGQACRKQTEQRSETKAVNKHRVSQETQQEVIRKTRQGSQIKYDTHDRKLSEHPTR